MAGFPDHLFILTFAAAAVFLPSEKRRFPPSKKLGLWLPRLHSVARTSDEKEHLTAGAAVVKICCTEEEEDEKKQAKKFGRLW